MPRVNAPSDPVAERPVVAVIEPRDWVVTALTDAGYGVKAIREEMGPASGDAVIGANWTEPDGDDDLVRALKASRVRAVFGFGDVSVRAAARLAGRASLLGPDPQVIDAAEDKNLFRQKLAAHGLANPAFHRVDGAEEARRAWDLDPRPKILKPISGTGSRGVTLITTRAELEEAVTAAPPPAWPLIMEDQIVGPEYSVEAVSARGRHHVIGVTEKATTGAPGFVETGHVFPAPLPPEAKEQIENATAAILDAIGLREGLSHTEVIFSPDGPVAIETHPRPGGDRITDLVYLATGRNLFVDAVAALFGEDQRPEPPRDVVAAVRFFSFDEGRVAAVAQPEASARPAWLHELVLPQLGVVLGSVSCSDDRHGHATITASDREELGQRFAWLASHITVRTV
jgi:predicted ATP-grasp superfamily ATP-dependent carboligase